MTTRHYIALIMLIIAAYGAAMMARGIAELTDRATQGTNYMEDGD